MSWLQFEEDCIITACVDGHIRIWARPVDGANNSSQVEVSSRPNAIALAQIV